MLLSTFMQYVNLNHTTS